MLSSLLLLLFDLLTFLPSLVVVCVDELYSVKLLPDWTSYLFVANGGVIVGGNALVAVGVGPLRFTLYSLSVVLVYSNEDRRG